MMKTLLLAVALWFAAAGNTFADPRGPGDPLPVRQTIFFAKNGNPDWLVIREGVQITAADLVRQYKSDLGLSEADELVLYRTDADDIGFTHYRYQQFHHGVEVDGAELLIHEKNGFVITLNGKLVRGLDAETNAVLSAAQATQRALDHVQAERYMWESPKAQAMLRRIKGDPKASFYPQPELVLADPSFSHDPAAFLPVWRMEVYAEKPLLRKQIYVNAATGTIEAELEMLHDQNTPGTAKTKYSGTRSIITDSLATDTFRLVESTRGGGIETYDMNESTDYDDAVDFIDHDNFWDNVNDEQDEAATDAHWGAEMTFDYYLLNHNYEGIDGDKMPLICYVHYDNSWSNARWTGDWALFGDGGSSWNALTSLDVVGHEFTHGVTGNNARLRYLNESGALNESFSDIFGAAIEFWADPDNSDWLVGEDFVVSGGPLRNMADPKAEGDPDTYKGTNWANGSADNGGVHTNSGVQNHWFYLLTEGGNGTNDKNDTFSVAGIGLDMAANIAFRNLRYYLAQLSTYNDARFGALQAAEDLYGICSTPVQETARAWHAVGIGVAELSYDIRMLKILSPAPESCGLGTGESVTVQFRYNGCTSDLAAGDKIPLSYQINGGAEVRDTLILSAPLTGGDTITYTFQTPTDVFATPGTYVLRCRSELGADIDPSNNLLIIDVESILEQNVDMGLRNISKPASSCFLATESPTVEIGFYGCDSIAAGEEITLFYSDNGGAAVSETIQLPTTLHRGETFKHNFDLLSDFSAKGPHFVSAWVQYGPDYLQGNDTLNDFRVLNPYPLTVQGLLSFEGGAATLDSVFFETERETQALISDAANNTGAYGYMTHGGDIVKAYQSGEAKVPGQNNVWDINEAFKAKMCFCADLSNLSVAQLRFMRKQTYSKIYLNTLGTNYPYFSALRVLVNGESVSVTYKPASHSSDPWFTHYLTLNDYLGSEVEICFQSHTGISPELDPDGIGDKVMLDNILLTGQLATGTVTPNSPSANWQLRPNPAQGVFQVIFKAEKRQALEIEVSDALGRRVHALHTDVVSGDNTISLNMEDVTPGVYFVRLATEEGRSTRKIVIE